ncbi:MAG: bifunctional adenosylcobinamide kinase/adenosylcobinamide-phosphate guanylyltransferase [bacterium]
MSLTFILGGARSGKSNFALSLAKGKEVAFIATALPLDKEMDERIRHHKEERPSHWKTVEEPINLLSAIKSIVDVDIIILDCLTMWVSNLLEICTDEELLKMSEDIAIYSRDIKAEVIAISNEVGLGIVPEYPLGRRYRDLLGRVNQTFAKYSNKIFFMIAGIPLEVKNESKRSNI